MKNIFKYMAVVAISLATFGLTSCEPESQPEPQPGTDTTYAESTIYAFLSGGRTLAAGETVVYNLSDNDLQNGEAKVDLFVKNKSDETQSTVLKIERMEGPESMNNIFFCHGTCKEVTCPYTSPAFQLAPGVDENVISLEFYPTERTGQSATYKLTAGKGRNMEDPQVVLVNFNL